MATNNCNSGTLYIVATPIGNLEDITLRALRVLKEVSFIIAEDTRHTRKLLNFYHLSTPVMSLHEHNEKEKSPVILSRIKSGLSGAYVTDAGTPCISDPGYLLIRAAHKESIKVVPIPGVSAVVAALSVSGFSADKFVFCGFLPAKKNARRKILQLLKEEERTMVFYESPVRFMETLHDIYELLGNREMVVARELTKTFEDVMCGKISDFIQGSVQITIKGEFTFILRGKDKERLNISNANIEKMLIKLWNDRSISLRDAVDAVVYETGLSRKKVYELAVKLRS